ncbi:MAG: lipoate--protein ligase [Flavobacteriales bacterium]|nr:lipoate--protein ligase [Flavobacteriales bacterium]
MDRMLLDILHLPTCAENLAYEEWYFTQFEQESLRLWVNPHAVVVGKHQNALSECNFHFCHEHRIPIVRRISGGGTVYHDPGNVNFSFFRWVQKEKMIDYDRSLNMIHKALQTLGYPVEMNERHDLFLEGKKISGNAQHLKKGRSLHHGTLLYDADLNLLRSSIKRTSGVFEDKAVRSVRSPISNLRAYKDLGDTPAFLQKLHAALIDLDFEEGALPLERELLDVAIDERYDSDDWNFGYSPHYVFRNEHKTFTVALEVERGGIIQNAEIRHTGESMESIERQLLGQKHHYAVVEAVLSAAELAPEDTRSLLTALF